jgi:hypothetical protein
VRARRVCVRYRYCRGIGPYRYLTMLSVNKTKRFGVFDQAGGKGEVMIISRNICDEM